MKGNGFALSRRRFLQAAGSLIVSFSLAPVLRGGRAAAAPEPVSQFDVARQLELAPGIDAWLKVDAAGEVTFFTGKVEIGNGLMTSLTQIVAEELDVPFERVSAVAGDTDLVPDQGPTSASATTALAGSVLRSAAAEARQALLEMAAERFGVPVAQLAVENGVVFVRERPAQRASYGELLGGRRFERRVSGQAPTKDPKAYKVVGQSKPRVDLPVKLTAAPGDYVENVRLPGMLHARLVRPPTYGGSIGHVPAASDLATPGVVAVVPFRFPGDPRLDRVKELRSAPGDFVAVVAEREEQAVAAAAELESQITWNPGPPLPTDSEGLYDWLVQAPAQELVPRSDPQGVITVRMAMADHALTRTYTGAYQSHAPMSPSCAVADVRADGATLWSAAQAPFMSRWIVSQALGMEPERVRIRAMDSSGLYGRRDNYDDEPDVEAALVSQTVGRPVRLVWSREHEFMWGPYRPPHVVRLQGAVEMGRVTALDAQVWFASRNDHPMSVIAGMGLTHFNTYGFGFGQVRTHRVEGPVRTAYMRNVFHSHNIFALESFVDELAEAAEADPVAFRLRHLTDERAHAVIRAAAERVGWRPRVGRSVGRGVGIAFTAYDSGPAAVYLAYAAEVEVERSSGQVRVRRIVAALDPGLVVNPDGLRNQIEGGAIQATSWALKEELQFDRSGIRTRDWSTYPILRFSEVPAVEPVIINRPDKPALGIGEPVTVPVAPAIANAIYDAAGVRVRAVPFTPERVRRALEEAASGAS